MRIGRRWTKGAAALAVAVISLTCLGASVRGALGGAEGGGEAKISVTAEGFRPGSVVLRRGVQSHITFVRQVAETCATEVVIQELGVSVALPLNEQVSVEVTPKTAGQFDYGCGDGVFHGTIIVR